MCKYRFGVHLLQNPPLCSSTRVFVRSPSFLQHVFCFLTKYYLDSRLLLNTLIHTNFAAWRPIPSFLFYTWSVFIMCGLKDVYWELVVTGKNQKMTKKSCNTKYWVLIKIFCLHNRDKPYRQKIGILFNFLIGKNYWIHVNQCKLLFLPPDEMTGFAACIRVHGFIPFWVQPLGLKPTLFSKKINRLGT